MPVADRHKEGDKGIKMNSPAKTVAEFAEHLRRQSKANVIVSLLPEKSEEELKKARRHLINKAMRLSAGRRDDSDYFNVPPGERTVCDSSKKSLLGKSPG
jgi:hypothetical protein